MSFAPGDSPTPGLDTLIKRDTQGASWAPDSPSEISIYQPNIRHWPKFYTKLVSAITRRRMNENQRFLGESSQNFTQILNPVSKQYFKHFSKIDLLGFAAIVFYIFIILYNFTKLYNFTNIAMIHSYIYIYNINIFIFYLHNNKLDI